MAREHTLDHGTNDRRSFIKLLAAAPLFASMGARSVAASVAATAKAATGRSFSNNIYTRLGVRPLINCRGPWTYLTASLELPEVRTAVEEASHYFVDMFELQEAAGRHLAKLSGAEDGMVTSGSAGAISSATAGCIAGTDPKNIYQLPDTTGMKGEVIILGGRSAFDSAIRLTGARVIVARTVNDLPATITSQTAMVYTTWGDDRLPEILKITKPAGVPVLIDLASGIPPYSNLTRLAKTGVDLYCIRRLERALRGPPVSGCCVGLTGSGSRRPEYNSLGAVSGKALYVGPMKVGKEEIMERPCGYLTTGHAGPSLWRSA